MRKIKNSNLKDATSLCCDKWSTLVKRKEKCSFCKHLTPVHLNFLKYKSIRFLSTIIGSLHVRRLCMKSWHIRLFVTNMIYLLLISVSVNIFSVIFVLRYLISLGPVPIVCNALPANSQTVFPFRLHSLACFYGRVVMCRPTKIFWINCTR